MEQTAQNNSPTLKQLQEELEREKYRGRYRQTLRSTVYILIVVAAIAVLLATLFFPVFRIYGMSMSPTVKEGEIVLSVKDAKFDCGNIVVLSFNNKLLVKRVIAGPGQWVDIDIDGNVYVDGVMIDEPYLTDKKRGDCTIELPYQVPESRYFVMGDNRSTSQDSRNIVIGCIDEEQIIGRVLLRVWPFDRFGTITND